MSDIIRLLPDAIANQIAAGEVIQRPASAVKEMMENAIDAGSSSIQLIIRDAGKTLIQVIDDGSGMSETDARMAFERHATSKIQSINDLFSIRTKGFRGEALASIAAVGQVELKTRQEDDELGTIIKISGTEVLSQEPCQSPKGTSLVIKNLFFNVPARRNFLKSNPVEMKHIIEEFQRIALAHPGVFFSLHHNDSEVFHLAPGNLRQRITALFGKPYNERIVPIDEHTDILKVYGFVGKPQHAKKTRGEQYFFVNNRFIKSPYLNHAVFNNYEDLVPSGSYPFFVLYMDIDPAAIDINVHPTKQEIKFEDERLVYQLIRASVKHGLAQYSVTPSLDFDQETTFSHIQAEVDRERDRDTNNSIRTLTPTLPGQSSKINQDWKQLMQAPESRQPFTVASKISAFDEQEIDAPFTQNEPYQIHNKFIISQIKSGFILIDQQAAHERILFERFTNAIKNNAPVSQKQLFPQTVHCSKDDTQLLQEILPDLQGLGFDVQEFGNNDFVIHGLPADINPGNEQQIIDSLLENYKQNLDVLKLEPRESVARSMAQQAAIKPGQKLSVKEMQNLIDEMFACEEPYRAPDKRLTFTTFNFQEIEKRLG